jgi:phenylalanyl-tRNA synthetase beta chain
MKVSLNKLRFAGEHYKVGNLVPNGVDELVEKIGAQLGAVEEVVPYGEKFKEVVIVKVEECVKHPNADKLSLCQVDDGSGSLVQVVCGAPNVRAGMLAAWLPPGSTVPSSLGDEPFVLEAREIRGQKSNGMLASPAELGISDNHDGILEVDVDVKPGTSFVEAYRLGDEMVIDIENKMFTHRPDLFGILGITREVAGIQQLPFKSPDWYVTDPEQPQPSGEELKVTLKNELPELVPRFMAQAISGVTIAPSPVWLQIVLNEAGIRPINNVVDYTNFWMLETGQPLHAYDYDKLKALSNGEATIVVRNPKPGEKVKLLNGKEIEPWAEAICIATDKQLIGVGGVMGGSETEVDTNTKNIILECANFDMYSVRRTVMQHGLFTDAATRFTKGQSPLQNLAVLIKAANETIALAGGQVAGPAVDDNHLDKAVVERQSLYVPVKVTTDFINQRLGLELSPEDMKKLLENVEFTVEVNGDELTIKAPFWRTDIELREDVVEEVGRLYGYDHLPLELPRRDLMPASRDDLFDTKATIRERLSRAGANEVLTYSFVHGDLLQKIGQDSAKAFQVSNALSPDLQYYRLSGMPSLLEKVHPNIKAGYDEFALFEIGKSHNTERLGQDGLPEEYEYTGLIVAAADKLKKTGAAYYQARKYLAELVDAPLVFEPISKAMAGHPAIQPYEPNRSAAVSLKDGNFLGIIGEFKPSISRALKLPRYTAGFEIDTRELIQLYKAGPGYQPLEKFPGVTQDLTLKVSADKPFAEVEDVVEAELGVNTLHETSVSIEPLGIYQKDDSSKNLTFRIHITGHNRTLTDKEVAGVLDKIAEGAKTKLKAERV